MRCKRVHLVCVRCDDDLCLSTLVLGEIRKGVKLLRPREQAKAAALERWLRYVEAAFDGRVPGIENALSDQLGAHERHQTSSGYRWPARGHCVDQRLDAGDPQRPRRQSVWARTYSTRSRVRRTGTDFNSGGVEGRSAPWL